MLFNQGWDLTSLHEGVRESKWLSSVTCTDLRLAFTSLYDKRQSKYLGTTATAGLVR